MSCEDNGYETYCSCYQQYLLNGAARICCEAEKNKNNK